MSRANSTMEVGINNPCESTTAAIVAFYIVRDEKECALGKKNNRVKKDFIYTGGERSPGGRGPPKRRKIVPQQQK